MDGEKADVLLDEQKAAAGESFKDVLYSRCEVFDQRSGQVGGLQ